MTTTIVRVGPDRIDLARRAVSEVHERPRVDEAALAAFLGDSACLLLVALDGDEIVGSVNGYALRHPQRPEPQFLLYELDVKPAWRRRGIATRLVAALVEAARGAGAFEVWVPTNASNEAAMATYRRCGFVRRHLDDAILGIELRARPDAGAA